MRLLKCKHCDSYLHVADPEFCSRKCQEDYAARGCAAPTINSHQTLDDLAKDPYFAKSSTPEKKMTVKRDDLLREFFS